MAICSLFLTVVLYLCAEIVERFSSGNSRIYIHFLLFYLMIIDLCYFSGTVSSFYQVVLQWQLIFQFWLMSFLEFPLSSFRNSFSATFHFFTYCGVNQFSLFPFSPLRFFSHVDFACGVKSPSGLYFDCLRFCVAYSIYLRTYVSIRLSRILRLYWENLFFDVVFSLRNFFMLSPYFRPWFYETCPHAHMVG